MIGAHLENFDVEPLMRESASEQVVHRILGMVRAGALSPGERLPGERELAQLFHVSRPTVREAVKALAVLGVIKSRHGGGIFISPLEASDLLGPLSFFLSLRNVEVDRLYEARALIEGEIAALATTRATGPQAVELDTLIAEQETVVANPAAYREIDTRFHRKLAEIADNPFLMRAAESMNVLGQEFRKIASETVEVIRGSVQDHKRILAAVRAGTPDAARSAMQEHMAHVLATTKLTLCSREAS